MKKSILLISLFFTASLFAEENDTKNVKSVKADQEKMLTNGFYTNIGVGLPQSQYLTYKPKGGEKVTIEDPETQDLGLSINLEFGNQFYFVNKTKFAFGLRATWLQLGISPSIKYEADDKVTGFYADAKALNVAPQFSFAPNDKFAVDVYVSGGLAGYGGSWKVPNLDDAGFGGIGYNVAPGLRFRYQKVALGFDYTYSRLGGNETLPYASDDATLTRKVVAPRFYFGIQF